MPRIPPLSRKKDDYYNSLCDHENKELIPEGKTALKWAWHLALLKAKKHESVFGIIISGLKNILEMWVVVIPTVMAFGTIALIIAEYTPLFFWMGIPLVPVLDLLKIPNSDILSQAVVISFADMFLPTILTNGLESEFARFVAGTLSICQVIFMSEVGGLLLGSRIPVTFKDLVYVFILRTMISLPIIALVGHIIFS
jgi:nucleoside recognition membrane protein YjiH